MSHLQIVNAPESTVIKYQNIGLDTLLHDSSQFAVEHLETGITDNGVLLVIRVCHLYSEGGSDLIPHAGKSILYMISAAFICLPDTLQITGKRAAGCHNVVIRTHSRTNGS